MRGAEDPAVDVHEVIYASQLRAFVHVKAGLMLHAPPPV